MDIVVELLLAGVLVLGGRIAEREGEQLMEGRPVPAGHFLLACGYVDVMVVGGVQRRRRWD